MRKTSEECSSDENEANIRDDVPNQAQNKGLH